MKDIMLDLETLGTGPSPAILQIAVVEFDLVTGETGAEFDTLIDLQSCIDTGMSIDASTLGWWLEQPKKVRADILYMASIDENPCITQVLQKFAGWVDSYDGVETVWGNGILADNQWLRNAFELADVPLPRNWNHRTDRDVRTIIDLAKRKNPKFTKPRFKGTRHNALHDCYHQIQVCHKAYKTLIGV